LDYYCAHQYSILLFDSMNSDKFYNDTLKQIDFLRKKGVPDSDIRMMRLRIRLRDMLEHKKKKRLPKRKLVPKLTSIRTITFQSISKEDINVKKYAYLGVAIAVGGIAWKFWKKD